MPSVSWIQTGLYNDACIHVMAYQMLAMHVVKGISCSIHLGNNPEQLVDQV